MKVLSKTVGAFQENAYLVVDETTNEAVFIDPGAEPDALIELVRKSGAELRAIWLTHAHLDHIMGVAAIHEATGAPIHLHPADRALYDALPQQAEWLGLRLERPPAPQAEWQALAMHPAQPSRSRGPRRISRSRS